MASGSYKEFDVQVVVRLKKETKEKLLKDARKHGTYLSRYLRMVLEELTKT